MILELAIALISLQEKAKPPVKPEGLPPASAKPAEKQAPKVKSSDDRNKLQAPKKTDDAKEKAEKEKLEKEIAKLLGNGEEKGENPFASVDAKLKKVEESFAKRDVSGTTVEEQKQIADEIEDILKKMQDDQNKKSSKKSSGKKKSQPQNNQQQKANKTNSSKNQSGQPKKAGSTPTKKAGTGTPGKEQTGTHAEVKDVWGHLNTMLRQEMSQFAKESYLPKYRELLEQYYATIASKSTQSKSSSGDSSSPKK